VGEVALKGEYKGILYRWHTRFDIDPRLHVLRIIHDNNIMDFHTVNKEDVGDSGYMDLCIDRMEKKLEL